MEQIEQLREGFFAGMLRQALERAHTEPEYIRYLHDLVQLEDEVENELAVVQENLRVAQADLQDAAAHREQVEVLHQHFKQGDIEATHYSSDGVASEDSGEVGRKQKGKVKARGTPIPKKVRREPEEPENEEWDSSSEDIKSLPLVSCRLVAPSEGGASIPPVPPGVENPDLDAPPSSRNEYPRERTGNVANCPPARPARTRAAQPSTCSADLVPRLCLCLCLWALTLTLTLTNTTHLDAPRRRPTLLRRRIPPWRIPPWRIPPRTLVGPYVPPPARAHPEPQAAAAGDDTPPALVPPSIMLPSPPPTSGGGRNPEPVPPAPVPAGSYDP
ncbi:hypothetical protein B0H14DRAFT_3501555 [Mycena olivaceomarginata]|nr:hypothetical protein B0H14DRAFT_3501555 [Mycena olivaceomarginata]